MRLIPSLIVGVLLSQTITPPAISQTFDSDDRGSREGIHVAGKWTIEIREADGTLVHQVVFHNALTPNGSRLLAQLLGGARTPGFLQLDIGRDICANDEDAPTPCLIFVPESTNEFRYLFKTLTTELPTDGPQAGNLVVRGNFTAQLSGSIEYVNTRIEACNSTVAASDCGNTGGAITVTGTTLDPFVPVEAGQLVAVEVELSFN